MDEERLELLSSEELFTVDQFCGMMVAERRMWFVIDQLFKGHKHTIGEWITLVRQQGIAVNQ